MHTPQSISVNEKRANDPLPTPSPGPHMEVLNSDHDPRHGMEFGDDTTCSCGTFFRALTSKSYWLEVWDRFSLEVLLVLANFPHLVIKVVIMAYGAQVGGNHISPKYM